MHDQGSRGASPLATITKSAGADPRPDPDDDVSHR
jgi:hypothetical protein